MASRGVTFVISRVITSATVWAITSVTTSSRAVTSVTSRVVTSGTIWAINP